MRPTAAIAGFLLLAGCASARDVWFEGLTRCASNDLLERKRLVFLGASNTIGPGSGWRLSADGAMELRFSLDRAVPDSAARALLIQRGVEADCDSLREEGWSVNPSLAIASIASIVRAEVGLDLASEKTTSVSVEGWRVDTLEEVAYEDWMVSSSSGMFGADLLVKGRDPRYVMSSAVAVRGLTASISIDASQAARLDVSLPLGTEKSAEAGLVLERTARDRVTIRSTREFYVVGTFVAVKGQVLGSFPSPDNALLSGEVPDLEGRVRITATEVQ